MLDAELPAIVALGGITRVFPSGGIGTCFPIERFGFGIVYYSIV